MACAPIPSSKVAVTQAGSPTSSGCIHCCQLAVLCFLRPRLGPAASKHLDRLECRHNPGLDNGYELQGGGLSLTWTGLSGVQIDATAATRFTSNPARDPVTGDDADGSRRELQLWISARWSL